MHTPRLLRFKACLAVIAMAAGTATLAPQAALAETHEHGAAAPAKLARAPDGRKWSTDAALRDGMGRIRALVEPQLAAAHAGQLDKAQYAALASRIEAEVGGIVANCKLEPQADAVLHVVIGEIGAGTDALSGKAGKRRPAQGLVQVARAVNDYAGHFEHPGFKTIRGVH